MNQDESQFEKDFGAVFHDLKRDGAACPDSAMLSAWHAEELDPEEAARVSEHLAGCAECLALAEKLERQPQPVDDVTWARAKRSLDERKWPWQTRPAWNPQRLGLIAAGVAALAIALVWLLPAGPPEISPMVRGSAPLTVMQPSGTVSQLEFRWQALPIHYAYVVEIAGEERQVAAIETLRPPLQADAGLLEILEPGTPYRWRVRAVDSTGEIMAESAWTEFQLRD